MYVCISLFAWLEGRNSTRHVLNVFAKSESVCSLIVKIRTTSKRDLSTKKEREKNEENDDKINKSISTRYQCRQIPPHIYSCFFLQYSTVILFSEEFAFTFQLQFYMKKYHDIYYLWMCTVGVRAYVKAIKCAETSLFLTAAASFALCVCLLFCCFHCNSFILCISFSVAFFLSIYIYIYIIPTCSL